MTVNLHIRTLRTFRFLLQPEVGVENFSPFHIDGRITSL